MQSLLAIFSSPGPELLQLGPFTLRWYGLLIAFAVFTGLNLSNNLARQRGLPNGLINDLMPILILSAVIGARIYYITFEWRNYKYSFLEMIAIWKGGIAIHGALLAGTLAIYLFCQSKKYPFFDVLDSIIPSVSLGQAIGRWGNFFNNEAFGTPTDLPWKLFIPESFRPSEFTNYEYFHPTFLYESLWNIIVFLFLIYLFRRGAKKKINLPSGGLTSIYLITYSLGRVFIENLRTDPLCLGALPPLCEGGIRIAQLMSILLIVIGFFILSFVYKINEKIPKNIQQKEVQK